MWRTIPASAFLRRLVDLSAALLVAVLVAMLVGALPVAHAQVPDCLGLPPTNTPTPGDDVIDGTAGEDVLAGGAGDDVIRGAAGNDVLCGNEGDDEIVGEWGDVDQIDGGPGNDDLGGGVAVASQSEARCGLGSGSNGEPLIVGQPADNIISGSTGDDSISGGGGVDYFEGGDGDDCLMGLDGNDQLRGDDGADFISAGAGSDLAVGGDDYDEIFAGSFPDESGNDELFAGHMSVQLPEWPRTCFENGEFHSETGPVETGDATRTPFAPKENVLVGADGYDDLVGTNRADNMQGDQRGDDLYGFGGEDFLRGGRASDCLSGGPDADNLNDADPKNEEPDDSDTLWGGAALWDTLNASDGDGLDSLKGGGDINGCTYDPGDGVSTLGFVSSICF